MQEYKKVITHTKTNAKNKLRDFQEHNLITIGDRSLLIQLFDRD
jgi:hypothetical protein